MYRYDIKSELVDYNTAWLAKQLGYNDKSFVFSNGYDMKPRTGSWKDHNKENAVTIPTKAELQKWLQKRRPIIMFSIVKSQQTGLFSYFIFEDSDRILRFGGFPSYDECIVAGFRESLYYLIDKNATQ